MSPACSVCCSICFVFSVYCNVLDTKIIISFTVSVTSLRILIHGWSWSGMHCINAYMNVGYVCVCRRACNAL